MPRPSKKLKEIKRLKTNLLISQKQIPSHIFVIAKDNTENYINIQCKRGLPLGGYVYDMVNDCYTVTGVKDLYLGTIPYCYQLSMPDSDWVQYVPIPEVEIVEQISEYHKKALMDFFAEFAHPEFTIKYCQFLDCR